MIIKDSNGNVITNPDYSLGRLEQSETETNVLVYWTWEEKPDVDSEGKIIDHVTPVPTIEDVVEALNAMQDIILGGI